MSDSKAPEVVAPTAEVVENKKGGKKKEERKPQQPKVEEVAQAIVQLTLEDIGVKEYGHYPLIQSQRVNSVEWTPISTLDESKAGQTVWIRARIHTSRAKGKACFLVLRDGLYRVQACLFASETIPKEMVKYAGSLATESVVDVQGVVSKVEKKIETATQQDVEIAIQKIYCVSPSEARLPLLIEDASRPESKEQQMGEVSAATSTTPSVNPDTRLNNRVLDLRVPAHIAIFRIQSMVGQLFREFLYTRQFVEIHTPKLISTASEGGTKVFGVKYFDREAFLAQSPQLYKQMAVMGDLNRVFEIGPVFRAEDSNTHRHLTEFVGLDLEMAIKEHYSEVLDVISDMFAYIFDGLRDRCASEIEAVKQQYGFEPFEYQSPALRLKFPEAVKMLREAGIEQPEFEDLSTETEKKLGKLVKEKYHTDFYMLEKYPTSARPFYTMPCPEDPRYTNSYDMFIRGEEICSGSQRIHDAPTLIRRAAELGVNLAPIQAYVDAFRYGAWPHAGAGIGLERVTMLYLGLGNIRKTSMFPRDPKRVTP